MGLDTSHDAFHGAYSAFNRFRQMICFVIGGSHPPHYEYNDDFSFKPEVAGLLPIRADLDENMVYFGQDLEDDSGLVELLLHSDYNGEISPEMCVKIADELEELLPKIESLPDTSGGHIKARGGYVGVTRKFIDGCRAAAAAGEPLIFH